MFKNLVTSQERDVGGRKAPCPVSLPTLWSSAFLGIAPGTPQDRLGEVGAGARAGAGQMSLWPQASQAEGPAPEPGWGLHVRPWPVAGVPGVASLALDPAPNPGAP